VALNLLRRKIAIGGRRFATQVARQSVENPDGPNAFLLGSQNQLREKTMEVYEIRICKGLRGPASIYRTLQDSDLAAITVALRAAGESDSLEVWKGMDCIHRRSRNAPSREARQRQDSGMFRKAS